MRKILVVFCIVLASLFSLAACSKETKNLTNEEWEPRNVYEKDGEVLLEVIPDPAEKPFGYLFRFEVPFEAEKIAIYAYHKETGEKITVISSETTKEPSSGNSTLESFSATFTAPKSGLWLFEVELDDKFYADAVVLVKDRNP
ncbi:hypothetical protein [Pradoshia sp.]